MKCPRCGLKNALCMESKFIENYRHRRYKCGNCDLRFGTRETVVEVKYEGDLHYTSTAVGEVDPKTMLESIKRPFAELRGVLRTYDNMLK